VKQQARKLVNMVYDAINANSKLASDLRFSSQFSSAAVSTMSNIAEGFSRETDKEFLRGLWISKASAAEVQSLSYTALDRGYLLEELRQAIYDQAEKVASLNSGMIKYLKNSSHRKKYSDSKTQRHNGPKDSKSH
jgi:four helix bundle protein